MIHHQAAVLLAIAPILVNQIQCSEGLQQIEISATSWLTGMRVQLSLNAIAKGKKMRGSIERNIINNGAHLAGTRLVINQ